jgi:hypothetical protein
MNFSVKPSALDARPRPVVSVRGQLDLIHTGTASFV